VITHNVPSWKNDEIGGVENVVSKLLLVACFVFISARIHSNFNPCHIGSTRRQTNKFQCCFLYCFKKGKNGTMELAC
jgi:hypothetical protein